MEPSNILAGILNPQGFSFFLQILIVFIQIIYVLFSFMLTRQIKIMNSNFKTTMAPFYSMAATVNFLASLGLVAFSILAL